MDVSGQDIVLSVKFLTIHPTVERCACKNCDGFFFRYELVVERVLVIVPRADSF